MSCKYSTTVYLVALSLILTSILVNGQDSKRLYLHKRGLDSDLSDIDESYAEDIIGSVGRPHNRHQNRASSLNSKSTTSPLVSNNDDTIYDKSSSIGSSTISNSNEIPNIVNTDSKTTVGDHNHSGTSYSATHINLGRQTRATTSSLNRENQTSSTSSTTTTTKAPTTKVAGGKNASNENAKISKDSNKSDKISKDVGELDRNSKISNGKRKSDRNKNIEREDDDNDEDDDEDDEEDRPRAHRNSHRRRNKNRRRYDDDEDATKSTKRQSNSTDSKSKKRKLHHDNEDDSDDDEDKSDSEQRDSSVAKHKGSPVQKSSNNTSATTTATSSTTTTPSIIVNSTINDNNDSHAEIHSTNATDSNGHNHMDDGGNNLDARSPSDAFAKKFNNMLANGNNNSNGIYRNRQQQQIVITTTLPPKSSYSTIIPNNSNNNNRNNNSGRIPSQISKNTPQDGILVQIVNQTQQQQQHNNNNNNGAMLSGNDLDWSKFVKVVFKSALDNQTLYTIVMNSSELNKHPINDWSSELPQLLERDFEKLVDKWSTVFPADHLLSDISKIIVTKIGTMPISSSSSSLAANINETLSTIKPLANGNQQQDDLKANYQSHNSDSSKFPYTMTTLRPLAELLNSSLSLNGLNHGSASPIMSSNDSSSTEMAIELANNSFVNSSPRHGINQNNNSNNNSANGLANPLSLNNNNKNKNSTDINTQTSNSIKNPTSQGPSGFNGSQSLVGKRPLGPDVHNLTDTAINNNNANIANKSLVDMVRGMNIEHVRIESNVKQQAESLRHFIIVCSVAIVAGTSVLVALILFFSKK